MTNVVDGRSSEGCDKPGRELWIISNLDIASGSSDSYRTMKYIETSFIVIIFIIFYNYSKRI